MTAKLHTENSDSFTTVQPWFTVSHVYSVKLLLFIRFLRMESTQFWWCSLKNLKGDLKHTVLQERRTGHTAKLHRILSLINRTYPHLSLNCTKRKHYIKDYTYNEKNKILQNRLHEIQPKQTFLIISIIVTRTFLKAMNIRIFKIRNRILSSLNASVHILIFYK